MRRVGGVSTAHSQAVTARGTTIRSARRKVGSQKPSSLLVMSGARQSTSFLLSYVLCCSCSA